MNNFAKFCGQTLVSDISGINYTEGAEKLEHVESSRWYCDSLFLNIPSNLSNNDLDRFERDMKEILYPSVKLQSFEKKNYKFHVLKLNKFRGTNKEDPRPFIEILREMVEKVGKISFERYFIQVSNFSIAIDIFGALDYEKEIPQLT